MNKYVCGHKNPDTDSVVAAVAYAEIEDGFEPKVSGEINKETLYVLKEFGYDVPEKIGNEEKRVVLVDHNSPEEMAEGIKQDEVMGIIDHHKLGGPFSVDPVEVYMKPYGSTSTIVAIIAEGHKKEISKKLAGLLIAGILSDTLNFSSPTTTEKDKEIARKLNEIAKLDMNVLAGGMFMAKSDITDVKTEELITKDYKVFEMTGKKVGIGVWETVKVESVLERKDEIKELLSKEKEKSGLDYIYFVAVDILNRVAYFVLGSSAEKDMAEKVFGLKEEGGLLEVPGIVSRKKQITPAFDKYFEGVTGS